MKAANAYFLKNGFQNQLHQQPHAQLGISVVIPSFNEPNLTKSLKSLASCQLPKCAVEVLVVINYPENSNHLMIENAQQCIEAVEQMGSSPMLRFHVIEARNLPKKHAGVGLARRIGMDEAAYRFAAIHQPKGIIACFDADATCASSYLVELEALWERFPNTAGCSIRFEHPLSGNDFPKKVFESIAQYELHLRYYVEASRHIGHPHAFHTVGSSMACSAETYLRIGGMNRRKAGEDFYFLQKIIPYGQFRELNSTLIFPSPRPSDRVPFGTGIAIEKMLDNEQPAYLTYCVEAWKGLKHFMDRSPQLYDATTNTQNFLSEMEPSLSEYLIQNGLESKLDEIRANTTGPESFRKRFFLWFDAFRLLKYLNHSHTSYYTRKPVAEAAYQMAQLNGMPLPANPSAFELLHLYRTWQAAGNWTPH